MKLPIYWVDAFTQRRFHGNPAAVVMSEAVLPAELMQSIATENNLAETAFVSPKGTNYAIRWFTPTVEVDICGHATLASAYALYLAERATQDTVEFDSNSGRLRVVRQGDRLALDFPAKPPVRDCNLDEAVREALSASRVEVYRADATMAVFASEDELRSLKPRMDLVARLPGYGLVVTAPGRSCDFVSRFFAPQLGIPEDAATGATHCTLIPYWSARFARGRLYAHQLSTRGGEFWCEDKEARVAIGGQCALYLRGEIDV